MLTGTGCYVMLLGMGRMSAVIVICVCVIACAAAIIWNTNNERKRAEEIAELEKIIAQSEKVESSLRADVFTYASDQGQSKTEMKDAVNSTLNMLESTHVETMPLRKKLAELKGVNPPPDDSATFRQQFISENPEVQKAMGI